MRLIGAVTMTLLMTPFFAVLGALTWGTLFGPVFAIGACFIFVTSCALVKEETIRAIEDFDAKKREKP